MTDETTVEKKDRRMLTEEEQKEIMDALRYRQKEGLILTIEGEVNFISGAGRALYDQGIDVPASWIFLAMAGRSIIPDYEYPYNLVCRDGKYGLVKNKVKQ